MSSALFLSDAHLGVDPPGALPRRAERLERLLRDQTGELSHLFLVGDLFEFWMEYNSFIPKGHLGLLSALRDLSRTGTEVHYSAGNHDFNLGSFFEKELGIRCHSSPFRIEVQGVRMWIAHGDGLDPDDRGYHLLKRILIHPFSNAVWKLLHPDLGMAIARKVGSWSRNKEPPNSDTLKKYRTVAETILAEGDLDAVVVGHTHFAEIKQLERGLFVNTGEWIVDPAWIRLEGGKFRIEKGGWKSVSSTV